ncbi:MAG TPA: hypothetical protein VFP84_36540 [Kofleriaceae bacterium]|nr:hypothetical protein [Kofleriaceae bacterium]
MRSAWIAIAVAGALVACESSDVSREVGARCTSSDDCDERCLAPSTAYPGGFCSLACERDGDCPGSTTCADVDGGVCLFTCTTDAECAFLGPDWGCEAVDLRGGGIKVRVCRG